MKAPVSATVTPVDPQFIFIFITHFFICQSGHPREFSAANERALRLVSVGLTGRMSLCKFGLFFLLESAPFFVSGYIIAFLSIFFPKGISFILAHFQNILRIFLQL
jgi:hypothetical protein